VSELNDLLRRYLEEGDAGAMEEIVKRTRPRLLATARRIGNPQDAEDSVQATYHALLRRGDRPLAARVEEVHFDGSEVVVELEKVQ